MGVFSHFESTLAIALSHLVDGWVTDLSMSAFLESLRTDGLLSASLSSAWCIQGPIRFLRCDGLALRETGKQKVDFPYAKDFSYQVL